MSVFRPTLFRSPEPAGSSAGASQPGQAGAQARSSAKETVVSIIIAFIMAFVFRGFVVEAFLIPTGSMAPTLLGANMRFQSSKTGMNWTANYSQTAGNFNGATGSPNPIQRNIKIEEPMTRQQDTVAQTNLLWGDRIFVMKYLGKINSPRRWDCIVFKNPNDPPVNYIKRLIGLPGEQIALIDGDVFYRTPQADDAPDANQWSLPGWKVARKPDMAQRAMWQLVFDSQYSPLNSTKDGRRWQPPWAGVNDAGAGDGWKLGDDGVYTYSAKGHTSLIWKSGDRDINDYYSYDFGMSSNARFPVSDIRLIAGVKPEADGLSVAAVLTCRGHNFRAEFSGTDVTVKMRPQLVDESDQSVAWQTIAEGKLPHAMPGGVVTNVEFWHVDQSVQVWVNDQLVAKGEYDWTPAQRVQNTLDMSLEDVTKNGSALVDAPYRRPQVRWEFTGAPFSLHRVSLWRDIYYQPDHSGNLLDGSIHPRGARFPALATHPQCPLSLSPDQFFVCGDNSPASFDARKWGPPHPWVAAIDSKMGVVHRDLIIGRAFFVYFPAPNRVWGLPVPDVGRMRWIW